MQTVELTPTDAAELTALYEAYDWWADREVESVREALANSIAIGIRDDGELVASARVVTDGVYRGNKMSASGSSERQSLSESRETTSLERLDPKGGADTSLHFHRTW